MKNIKFGAHVRVIKIPSGCAGVCEHCLGNMGHWTDTSPSGQKYPNGIFAYDRPSPQGGTCCGAVRPEHLELIYKCKLKNKRKE